ncbi:modulator of drug activity B [Klebsiella pneumoniae]|nr:modulator of drug activity B [Klebsiella pneumoniae]
MLSLTWNAPMEAFTDKDQFFHGVGVDGVYLPFHKSQSVPRHGGIANLYRQRRD